jgi:hypothetical protein
MKEKTKLIKLAGYGQALSGRSSPQEILSNLNLGEKDEIVLELDGLMAVNSAFINELLKGLLDMRIETKVVGGSERIRCLFLEEIQRLNQIYQFQNI